MYNCPCQSDEGEHSNSKSFSDYSHASSTLLIYLFLASFPSLWFHFSLHLPNVGLGYCPAAVKWLSVAHCLNCLTLLLFMPSTVSHLLTYLNIDLLWVSTLPPVAFLFGVNWCTWTYKHNEQGCMGSLSSKRLLDSPVFILQALGWILLLLYVICAFTLNPT